ncbi:MULTISPECIES: hypothetical protein [unclassified Pseudomonas]|uniref:hypothetical protein n=1 Tax=unclassified Pseudomonas TaxID=196821 RepID=UPI002AC92293|nr:MULTISPECIES: hypothetical protein [unclassified Pseudomonas]MEB0045951.1 hypothetical protein [Pseudomonas sp. Dout3]MEB0097211.1 hypothetical protein [Pseudomonas sp. DC1.2]WPX56851.1 hypothetical protein RHM68_14400 [Pseudomonas sp. DC1.2]
MKRLVYLAVITLGLSLTGCVSFTPLGPIGQPLSPAPVTLDRNAEISAVVISAPGLDNNVRNAGSKQLTEQISAYVDKSDYFKRTVVFPAKAGEDDVVLKFNLTSLAGKRTVHPAYLPGALLTLTIWIWVDGPIYIDKYDLAGELIIEDRHGKQLAKSVEQVKLDKNVGMWSSDYLNAGLGATQLRELIAHLLASATPQLQTPSKELTAHE